MKPGFVPKVMGSNPEFEKLICSGENPVDAKFKIAKRGKIMTWTEQDDMFRLIIGGNTGVVYHEGEYWSAFLLLNMKRWDSGEEFNSSAEAKSAVEEILSLLQPKAKELVWTKYTNMSASAETEFGCYTLWQSHEGIGCSLYHKSGAHSHLGYSKKLKDAKAKGQSHFNALVQEMME